MKVALLGMGASADQYMRSCARHGSRRAFDQLWTCNSYGSIFHADITFHMDDVRIQKRRAAADTEESSWIGEMLDWFTTYEGLVYTSRSHPDYPCLVDYPLEQVIKATKGPVYYNGTMSYALGLAYASHSPDSPISPVTELSIFGCDFDYAPGIWKGEKGRACMEYWIGRIQGESLFDVKVPKQTSLMDINCLRPYGYDTHLPKITTENGKAKVLFDDVPEDKWPTVEDIEDRYAKR